MKSRLFWLTLNLLLLMALALGAFVWWLGDYAEKPTGKSLDSFVVQRGDSLSQVAKRLEKNGIVSNYRLFMLIARLNHQQSSLKAGEYQIAANLGPRQILDKMTRGDVVRRMVRLTDGHSFRQFRESLSRAKGLKHVIDGLDDASVMKKLGHEDVKPEGMFFPATYDYKRDDTDLAILARAYEKMQAVLTAGWKTRTDKTLKKPYDALVLASIVEKETAKPEERPLIAGVFLNRLRKGMKLQTDPTVIYGMGDAYKGNIRKKDLLRDTPYNTYTRFGLPPTPIANPGKEALSAVFHPIETKALYFVAKGDGSHYFSTTLAEHNKAVYRYQIARKKP